MNYVRKKSGFSLIEVLITMIIVGILSSLCGMMLIFAYSMFEKVMGNGTASIEYKTFRLRTEKIFRNMTKDGAIAGDYISSASEIKIDVEYYDVPYKGNVYTRKYFQPQAPGTGTGWMIGGSSSNIDPGTWAGHVGRTVSLYSCVEKEKKDENYKRYLMTMEVDEDSGNNVVALYSWPLINGSFVKIVDEYDQKSKYSMSAWKTDPNATREILLSDVEDFQITTWLSNLYVNRIKAAKYEDISVVRLYIKLGEDSDAQYSNDMIFANKSVYGNTDSFFESLKANPERVTY